MRGFNFQSFFAPEGIDLIGAIVHIFGKEKGLKSLTIDDLVKSAIAMKWIEPIEDWSLSVRSS